MYYRNTDSPISEAEIKHSIYYSILEKLKQPNGFQLLDEKENSFLKENLLKKKGLFYFKRYFDLRPFLKRYVVHYGMNQWEEFYAPSLSFIRQSHWRPFNIQEIFEIPNQYRKEVDPNESN